jgi:mono/diheme cytochrome c family protein
MKVRVIGLVGIAALFLVGALRLGGSLAEARSGNGKSALELRQEHVARGKYLVDSIGCADCHTPLVMGPNGPARDLARALSGHPEQMELPPAPAAAGPWIASAAATLTAWAGPWGTSFTANLTPDKETGLGTWTEDNFVQTIRKGRHLGSGRTLLPPMPAPFYANLRDEDLKAIFAYLQTIPAVKNRVPAPRPPAEAGPTAAAH